MAFGANSPSNLGRWLSSLAFAVQPWDAPLGVIPAQQALLWTQRLPLRRAIGVGSRKPSLRPGEAAPPVPHAGCIFRSLSALVKTEGISLCSAFSGSPVSLERSQTETSPRRVWNGSAGQLGMPVRQPACSLPSPWLSLRFVALLLSCCYCHPPRTPPATHQAPRPFLSTLLNPWDSLYRD